MATLPPRPSSTLRSTKCAAALKSAGTPSASAERAVTSDLPSALVSDRQQGDDLVRERPRRERPGIDAGDAVRRFANQPPGRPLVHVEREADPPLADRGDAHADRNLVAEFRRRSNPGLQRGPRHEDPQPPQQRRPIGAQVTIQIFFSVLEVAEEDAEPDDAGWIGVGPHHPLIDVMEERHRPAIIQTSASRHRADPRRALSAPDPEAGLAQGARPRLPKLYPAEGADARPEPSHRL